MKKMRSRKLLVVLLVWVVSIVNLPWPAAGADPGPGGVQSPSAAPVRDVELGSGGTLSGQVVNQDGKPQANAHLSIVQDGRLVGKVQADAQGRFAATGLRGGTYQISTGQQQLTCRCWAPRTAPPAASKSVLLVSDGAVQRGQRPISDFFFSDPLLIGVFVAAAITIPIVISNSRDDKKTGS